MEHSNVYIFKVLVYQFKKFDLKSEKCNFRS